MALELLGSLIVGWHSTERDHVGGKCLWDMFVAGMVEM